jgi:hypothetical protein
LDENSIDFYFLDSTYYLQKRKLKLFYDFNYNSYNFSINDSQTSSYPVDSDFPQDNNAILYNLKKSGKIGYMSFYNNTVYIVSWGKEDLTNFNRINFIIPDYNLTQNLYSTMVEYDTNKIYVASIALNNSDGEYYLIIYSVDLESRDYNKLYESKYEGKKTFYSTIKMSYIEEKNKLYIAWGYSKDGKDYVSISEFDFKTKKLVDRLKIDISGKYLVDIDIKRLFASGISGSNFFIVYLVNDISGNQYNVGYVKTDDFSDSNWSYNIIKGFTSELIFSNFADSSSYLFINLSRYDNSVPQLYYNLSLIY